MTTRKKLNKLHCGTGYWLPCSLFKFFLKLLVQWCWKFSEGYLNNFSTELSSQIFDCCPRNFLIQKERIGNVVSTSHWIRPVYQGQLTYVTYDILKDGFDIHRFSKRSSWRNRDSIGLHTCISNKSTADFNHIRNSPTASQSGLQ